MDRKWLLSTPYDPMTPQFPLGHNQAAGDYAPPLRYDTTQSPDPQYTEHKENFLANNPARAGSSYSGVPLGYYPLSLIIIILWVVFIGAEIYLLERSVALAPTVVKLPWYYSIDGLPGIFLTIFSQGHAPVTAMHFGRLAVSGLRYRSSSPNTWMELFWLTDGNWSGPVGIVTTTWATMRHGLRVSFAFVMFSALTLVALVTPIVLNRAYPIQTIDVDLPTTFNPSTLSPFRLGSIDAYAEIGAGSGAWATNQSAIELFNATSYTPAGRARNENSDDFFFAGDVQGFDTTLPGLRIQGGCHAIGHSDIDTDGFADLCHTTYPSFTYVPTSVMIGGNSIALNVSFCSDSEVFSQFVTPSKTSAMVWFNNTAEPDGIIVGDIVRGVVRCDTVFTSGDATVYGRNLTYDHFVPNNTLYNDTQAGEPLVDPMSSALYHLSQADGANSNVLQAQYINLMAYSQTGNFKYISPSLDEFAQVMWRGAVHMTARLAILSRDTTTEYPAVMHTLVPARTRDNVYFLSTIGLLGVWLLGVVILTMWMWRGAFDDSLSGYVSARLWADRWNLTGGRQRGSDDEQALLDPFIMEGHDSASPRKMGQAIL